AKLAGGDVDGHVDRRQAPREPMLILAACLEEHPFAYCIDHADFLGERDEAGRFHKPQSRALPPDQRLDADDAISLQIHLRLVVQDELPSLERRAQLALELPAIAYPD